MSRVIIRPPGHSGKAKRGHLCFDAAFETGNLGRADLVGEFEYDLFLRPDTCNPRYRFWFNFTVDNVKQDQVLGEHSLKAIVRAPNPLFANAEEKILFFHQIVLYTAFSNFFCFFMRKRVIFNIVNISKHRNLFKYGLTPLVKSSTRPKWQRLPKNHVFYYKSTVHQNHYVLSFAFAFEKEDEVYQFAIAPPYSYSRLQAYLTALETKFRDRFERVVLAKSLVSCLWLK